MLLTVHPPPGLPLTMMSMLRSLGEMMCRHLSRQAACSRPARRREAGRWRARAGAQRREGAWQSCWTCRWGSTWSPRRPRRSRPSTCCCGALSFRCTTSRCRRLQQRGSQTAAAVAGDCRTCRTRAACWPSWPSCATRLPTCRPCRCKPVGLKLRSTNCSCRHTSLHSSSSSMFHHLRCHSSGHMTRCACRRRRQRHSNISSRRTSIFNSSSNLEAVLDTSSSTSIPRTVPVLSSSRGRGKANRLAPLTSLKEGAHLPSSMVSRNSSTSSRRTCSSSCSSRCSSSSHPRHCTPSSSHRLSTCTSSPRRRRCSERRGESDFTHHLASEAQFRVDPLKP
mmetsp:Transcript_5469/g.15657  ORF Transcript_5469/g.15657 Transcript_5469/m.15657 type:complete len:337 (+) Transcript_5469:1718-2728(+)